LSKAESTIVSETQMVDRSESRVTWSTCGYCLQLVGGLCCFITTAEVIWQKAHNVKCKNILSISSSIFVRWQHTSQSWFWASTWDPILEEEEVIGVSYSTVRKSDGGFI